MLDLAQLQKSWAGEQPESQLSNFYYEIELESCGCNSAVECQLPKLNVAGSNPVTRLKIIEERSSSRLDELHNLRTD